MASPWSRLLALVRRERLEQDLDEELRLHVELETQENLRRGMAPDEARRAALLAFGGVDRVKEDVREAWGVRTLETLGQDVRYGLRTLLRDRAYAAAVLLTLALGIGANTAVFSVVRGVLLKPLPYARGEQVVVLRQPEQTSGAADLGFSVPEIMDYRAQARTLDSVVEFHSMSFTLFGGPEPRRVLAGVVSANFFDVLEVKPRLGRTFRSGEDAIGAEAVLVLSHEYWSSLGEDPGIVGRRFEMNDRVHTVVGVLPPLPHYPDAVDVFMPASACPFRSAAGTIQDRKARILRAMGRVKEGVSLEQAQADVTTVAARLQAAHPDALPRGATARTVLTPLQHDLVKGAKPTLLVLLATVALVLLIACANVANLALARLSGRSRELAVRAALGASRLRLFRQLATETTVLALGGGALGIALAYATRSASSAFVARFTPRAHEIEIDGAVLAFTLVLSLLTGLLAGTLPGLPRELALARALTASSGRTSGSRAQTRLRSWLVVWQLAFSFVLLIGAALMLRSLGKLAAVDAGFRSENVMTVGLNLNFSRYRDDAQAVDVEAIRQFWSGFHAEMKTVPGVVHVAEAWTFPLNNAYRNDGSFRIEGRGDGAEPRATFIAASPEYFDAIGVPLQRGRVFTEHDVDARQGTVLVSSSLARRHWGDVDPVGARLSADDGKTWRTIVGVVGDVRQRGLQTDPVELVYLPFNEFPGFGATVFVRTLGDPRPIAQDVRAAAHRQDPQAAVSRIRTMDDIRSEAMSRPRQTTGLLTLFAFVALAISAAGLSGLIAYSVSQRTREFGIRIALGADPGRVRGMVLREGLVSVGMGLALGVVGALGLSHLASSLLFGVEPTDPLCFVGSAGLLLAVAVLACVVPARRATTIEPMRALRAD
jgi:putative ABC transport system permease protein